MKIKEEQICFLQILPWAELYGWGAAVVGVILQFWVKTSRYT